MLILAIHNLITITRTVLFPSVVLTSI
jgi:hypothetical protein